MIGFDKQDLMNFLKEQAKPRIDEELCKRNWTTEDLYNDQEKMNIVGNAVPLIQNKEEEEVFFALEIFPEFYKTESRIWFILKPGIDPKSIVSMEILRSSLKENDLTDFLLQHADGFRAYQLKGYWGSVTTHDLFEFLKKKLLHYCNDLGSVNLAVVLRSSGDLDGKGFFEDLSNELKSINIKGAGHILIIYNEENKFSVMNTVYPFLGTTRIPYTLPSQRWVGGYNPLRV